MSCATLPKRFNQPVTAGVLSSLLLMAAIVLPADAYAQFGPVVCSIVDNNVGILSAIASLGVILLGMAATLGKVTWTQALLVVIGISVLGGFIVITNDMVAWSSPGSMAAIAARCPGW